MADLVYKQAQIVRIYFSFSDIRSASCLGQASQLGTIAHREILIITVFRIPLFQQMQQKILCYQKRIYLYLPLNLNIATGVFLPWDYSARTKTKHLADGCSRYLLSIIVLLRPQIVNTLFIVRLRPNMSMRRAVIINY